MQGYNLIGQKFGRLLVLEQSGTNKWQEKIWRCKCDCGNLHEVLTSMLMSGSTKSCGCLNKEAVTLYHTNRNKSMIGQRFGKLVVTKFYGRDGKGRLLWECLCDCGNTALKVTEYLKNGDSKSCGCLLKNPVNAYPRGEKHPCYCPKLSDEDRKRERLLLEDKLWVKSVYKRDGYTCACCGHKSKGLNAHHIYNYAKYKNLRYNLRNGITLCERCHIEFHKIYGKQDNTWAQLSEFFNNKGKVLRIPIYRQSIKIA